MTEAAAWTVVLPLAGGAVTFLSAGRGARLVGTVGAAGTLLLSCVAVREVVVEGSRRIPVGGWGAPLGIELHLDGPAAAMLLTTALLSIAIGLYGAAYFDRPAPADENDDGDRPEEASSAADGFRPLLLFVWAALNALFLSADIFNIYVALELMTLGAVALVVLAEGPEAMKAAMRYLLAAFLGSLAYLLGVAILYGAFGTLDLALLGQSVGAGVPAWAALALVTGGLSLKTALFPVHFWLPRAHSTAPAPVSALLSALVVTASFYLILRFWVTLFPSVVSAGAAQLMGTLGALAIVWGSIQAIRQQHLKLMIAYSTVAQVGYLFLILPLTAIGAAGSAMAWSGGLYHAISHAFAKAAMFMAAGSIIRAVGSDRIVGMSGISTHLPVSTYAFGIAGLTLVGLPPTGGFVGKWLLLSSAIESGQWWWAVVVLVGSLLTAGYIFLVLGQELSESDEDVEPHFSPVPRAMEYTAMALAVTALLLGLRATELLDLLNVGAPFGGGDSP